MFFSWQFFQALFTLARACYCCCRLWMKLSGPRKLWLNWNYVKFFPRIFDLCSRRPLQYCSRPELWNDGPNFEMPSKFNFLQDSVHSKPFIVSFLLDTWSRKLGEVYYITWNLILNAFQSSDGQFKVWVGNSSKGSVKYPFAPKYICCIKFTNQCRRAQLFATTLGKRRKYIHSLDRNFSLT